MLHLLWQPFFRLLLPPVAVILEFQRGPTGSTSLPLHFSISSIVQSSSCSVPTSLGCVCLYFQVGIQSGLLILFCSSFFFFTATCKLASAEWMWVSQSHPNKLPWQCGSLNLCLPDPTPTLLPPCHIVVAVEYNCMPDYNSASDP